ncbi:MAG TPA: hypothetical protein DD640_08465 [Clostridiales bacterium]|nr:hypothetical protein [Clostridiales bacterium]
MKRPDNLEQVKKRVQDAKEGSVFIPSDFFDIAESVKINMCLDRLQVTGYLQRIMRGIYVKPRFSELMNKYIPPRTDDVAKAIARNYGWTIVPCGDTALNLLRLSAQVPAVWLYVSDGPYKEYEADGMTLKFKHTDNKKELINISYITALVVQALKALGKGNVSDKEIRGLSKLLSEEEKTKMLDEAKRVTAWVYDFIRIICKEGSYE